MAEKEYIDREAAKYVLRERYRIRTHFHDMESAAQLKCAELEIGDIPAADVRPVVRAHWYWDKDGMDWNIGAWRCSACKAMSPMWWNADRGSPRHKSGHRFCPNCGADMGE